MLRACLRRPGAPRWPMGADYPIVKSPVSFAATGQPMVLGQMQRRDFLTLLGGAAAAWPLAARAAGKRPHVAVLTLLSPQDERGRIVAFGAGMRELGYVAGQTFDIDYRYAEGDTERLRPLARELIALAPDVMFAGEPSAARAVKALAPNLPIVCPVLGDHLPDLFASYARPGGSVTGVASIVEGVNAKLVELANDAVPGLMRVGLLVNPAGANRALVEGQVDAARPRTRHEHTHRGSEQVRRARARVGSHGASRGAGRNRAAQRLVHQSAQHDPAAGARGAIADDIRRPWSCRSRRLHELRRQPV